MLHFARRSHAEIQAARFRTIVAAASLAMGTLAPAQESQAQAPASLEALTPPGAILGFDIGDDYHLATYSELVEHWRILADESPRVALEEIGTTAEGRPQYMAIVTSPANHANLERFRDISLRLALAEDVSEEEARALAEEGKAVVWIDGGLHATEVLGAHQLMEIVWQLASRDDAETLRILDDVIVLAVLANPDGMDLVSNWYMRESEPEKRSTSGIPRLYQKYIGHDNNRDFYMVTQPETENMTRVMFHEWFPQIVYNHHQTGPAGTVMFAPPFRGPFNYHIDPLVILGIDMVGAAMHGRLVAEGKPGTTMRHGARYSTWWNGGLRTVTYFHNMIGLLTETIGNPTPMEIPFLPDRQLASNDLPAPIEPQKWRFRQSIDYSVTANYAVLDYASRYRKTLLHNAYRMARNSIERGSADSWTIHPRRIRAAEQAIAAERETEERSAESAESSRRSRGAPTHIFEEVLRDPDARDPRGYIIPSDQADFPTAIKFVNALIKTGVAVHRATADFEIGAISYPVGSYVVKTAQAFRPHVLDMFEPQIHPNDFEYPGGPPIPPYDYAGWTLAYLMGVEFDRVLEGFDGPFERIEGLASPSEGLVALAETHGPPPDDAAGFLLSSRINDAAVAANRLLAAGAEVFRLAGPTSAGGREWPAGTMYVPATHRTRPIVGPLTTGFGLPFTAVSEAPPPDALRLKPVRIGLWDRYGGSMASGWTRWLLEQFEFPFEVVFPRRLDEGSLRDDFDVLVFVTGAIPSVGSNERSAPRYSRPQPDPAQVPEEYRERLGRVTKDTTIPALREFLDAGGTIITVGSSTALAEYAGLPVSDYLVDYENKPLAREELYTPGSIHRVRIDTRLPVTWGLDEEIDVFMNRSPVFRLPDEPETEGLRPIAWFESNRPLRSGWAWGQEHLAAGTAMAEADVGRGTLYLFGPEILNRGQTHGTFKLFFNAIQLAGATPLANEAAAEE
jgi:hypothetical protein